MVGTIIGEGDCDGPEGVHPVTRIHRKVKAMDFQDGMCNIWKISL
jgi:hypothetical protein